MKKEFEVSTNHNHFTNICIYIYSNKTINNIVHDYSSLIKQKYNIISTLPNLPFIYWIPKFHKYPTDFRFITSGRYTVINTISKKIDNALQSMLKLEKTQCNFNHKYDGIKNYYIHNVTKK